MDVEIKMSNYGILNVVGHGGHSDMVDKMDR